jgi:hypothetical protein
MKKNARHTMMMLAALGCIAMSAPACVVRGGVRAGGDVAYEAPPPPRYRVVRHRPGHVWVRGRWVWRNGRYVWRNGHWRRARAGYHWVPGRWVARNGRYYWVRGRWRAGNTRVVVTYPTAPPPAPRYTQVRVRPGFVWVRGRYVWRNGRYTWRRGHYQRVRAGHVWSPGRWVRRGNRYVWVSGRWTVRARGGVRVRDHRR